MVVLQASWAGFHRPARLRFIAAGTRDGARTAYFRRRRVRHSRGAVYTTLPPTMACLEVIEYLARGRRDRKPRLQLRTSSALPAISASTKNRTVMFTHLPRAPTVFVAIEHMGSSVVAVVEGLVELCIPILPRFAEAPKFASIIATARVGLRKRKQRRMKWHGSARQQDSQRRPGRSVTQPIPRDAIC